MPAVNGKSGGICRIEILRDSSPLHLKFTWGSEASKPGKEKKIVEVVAQDGASAQVFAVDHDHSVYHLEGKGFHPNEPLNLILSSGPLLNHQQITADVNGNFPALKFLPKVSGKPGGVCYVDILRDNAPIHMKFTWEAEASRAIKSPKAPLSTSKSFQ